METVPEFNVNADLAEVDGCGQDGVIRPQGL